MVLGGLKTPDFGCLSPTLRWNFPLGVRQRGAAQRNAHGNILKNGRQPGITAPADRIALVGTAAISAGLFRFYGWNN